MSRNIALLGMMGAGKTTVAALVADALGRTAVDTDAEIERWVGDPIPVIFATRGEAVFRDLERQVVEELAKLDDLVLALGGGTVLRDDNVASLALTGVLVELRARPEVLIERLRSGSDGRPLLTGDLDTQLRKTYDERADRYAEVADLTVDAERPPAEVARAIIDWTLTAGDVLTPSEHEQVMR
ncbi:MAG: shikimate kinase [Actinobacteria bacterium]|nr:shikimate kinase [Actinomycetota bacterium]